MRNFSRAFILTIILTIFSMNIFAGDLLVKEGQSLRPFIDAETTKLIEAKKYTFLNFWATWCLPCVQELPDLVKFSSEQNKNSINVLLVNADEKRSQVEKFLKKKEISLTNVFDKERKMIDAFGISTLPYTFIVDKELKLVRILRGNQNLEKLNAEVLKLK